MIEEFGAIIYRTGGFQLVYGTREHLEANCSFQLERHPDAVVRFTEGTEIAGLISGIDPRVPATVEEFDELYGPPES